MESIRVGFAFCGSFCTYHQAMTALERVRARYGDVTPIVSEASAATDSRFGPAHEYMREMERICGKRVIDSIPKAEPIGPKHLLDVLVICPCTGNTLAKLANGITDTTVTMAAKAHLRNGAPVVLCLATNDGLAASAKNIGALLDKKNVYFVPFGQDDPAEKPTSLVADFTQVCDTVDAALQGEQLQPLLLRR
ncbi:dipicolinate synthase subunit B [uncultured Flavonifractor sp.]|uniref:dipicolinate synthase subunit B n=1 Tax=uncultured Flavonifractor sp. TaxID=1193534 RepID=UPI0026365F43|nr:dipicolinate synthase subunit B [uncultured Flavonifractor sp.]